MLQRSSLEELYFSYPPPHHRHTTRRMDSGGLTLPASLLQVSTLEVAAVNIQKVFNPEQIGRIWREPLFRKAILFGAPIVVLVAVSYIFGPSERMVLALFLLYSVFIVVMAP